MKAKKVVAVVGPTCSGKTALSLLLAKQFGGEILACDSRTIYKYMDIGTAKPSKAEQAQVPHHLIDVVEPTEVYTVARFKRDAEKELEGIFSRGNTPIVCGGTGFYSRALLQGLDMPSVEPQEALRASLREQAESEGLFVLRDRLNKIDPVSSKRIQENDLFRLIRAIEVYEVTGRPFSELATYKELPFEVLWIGLTFDDRAKLKQLMEKRLALQIEQGLVQEVEQLISRFGEARAIAKAINYREFIPLLRGQSTLDPCLVECLKDNYQLARRQLIWFRGNPEIHWLSVDRLGMEGVLAQSLKMVSSYLAL